MKKCERLGRRWPARRFAAMIPPMRSRAAMVLQLGTAASLAIGATVAFPLRASAALGDHADSIEADAKAVGAVRKESTDHRTYMVERLQKGSTEVREYLSPEGKVFAVAWDGPAHPDLGVLLGSHAEAYRNAVQQRGKGSRAHRSQRVAAEDAIVETWGHARRLQGRAYLPAELPRGVDVHDIK